MPHLEKSHEELADPEISIQATHRDHDFFCLLFVCVNFLGAPFLGAWISPPVCRPMFQPFLRRLRFLAHHPPLRTLSHLLRPVYSAEWLLVCTLCPDPPKEGSVPLHFLHLTPQPFCLRAQRCPMKISHPNPQHVKSPQFLQPPRPCKSQVLTVNCVSESLSKCPPSPAMWQTQS